MKTVDQSEPCTCFSVMSLNIRFGLAEDGPNNWCFRQNAYPPLLSMFPGDFYAFQEVNDFQFDFLADLLPEHHSIGRHLPAPERWQNNIIFHHHRWRCIHHEHFFLSDTPDIPSCFAGSRWPRQCTMGIFAKASATVVILSTHFDFSSDVQVRSAHLIRQRLHGHADKGPIVIMGDFNAPPESPCYAEFTTRKEDGYPVFKNAFARPYEGTHHGFKGTNEGAPIDWILV